MRDGNDATLGNPFGVSMPQEERLLLNAPDGSTRQVLRWLPTDGSAPRGTVVFLHGYGGTARRWQHACKWHTDQGMQVRRQRAHLRRMIRRSMDQKALLVSPNIHTYILVLIAFPGPPNKQ
jgi:pimeloyl-ACP methyl ester carboxylesterase